MLVTTPLVVAAKAVRPNIPLWHLVIADQLIDFAWASLILIGIEKGEIVEGYTVEFPFNFYYMPFSHSLPAVAIWCVAELLSNVVYSKLTLGGFPAVDCAFINTVDELHAGNHISELPEST